MRARCAWLAVLALACHSTDRQATLPVDSAVRQRSLPPFSATPRGDSESRVVDSAAAPLTVLAADSAAGATLFRQRGACITCHGPAGAGIAGLGPSLADSVWLAGGGTFPSIERAIIEGVPNPSSPRAIMPAFGSTLSARDAFLITAYIYAIAHPGSAVLEPGQDDSSRAPPVTRAPNAP